MKEVVYDRPIQLHFDQDLGPSELIQGVFQEVFIQPAPRRPLLPK